MTDPASPAAEAISPRRKWLAIGIATMILVVSYSAIVVGLVAAEVEDGPDTGPALALGLGLAPFVFLILAFGSGHRRAPGAVLRAMGLAILVSVPVSAILQDAITGLVAGYGAGGVVSLRADAVHTWRSRAIGVAIVSLYVAVLVRVVIEAGLIAGAILPLVSIGLTDSFMEFRAGRGTPASGGP